MTCSSRGFCCCSVRLLACSTVFGCFHLRSQLCSLPNMTMTATFCAAWPSHIVPGDADPLPQPAAARANLCLRHGGLGLRSAAEHAPAAYFASWADSLSALRVRAPDSCHVVARLLDDAAFAPSLPRCLSSLAGAVQPPAFADLPPHPPVGPADPDEPVDTTRGWQRPASRAIDNSTAGRFHSADPLLRGFSLPCPPATSSPWTHLFCEPCCSAGFACPFRSTLQLVAAAAPSTLSATTTLLAPVLASCAPVASRACCCPDLPRSRGYSCLQCSGARPQHLNIHPERLDDRRIEVIAKWTPALGRSATCCRHHPRVPSRCQWSCAPAPAAVPWRRSSPCTPG